MSDVNKELNEIMKEFNRHNLDAVVSTNYLENTQVLHIDTTRHDIEVIQNYIYKVVKELEFLQDNCFQNGIYEAYENAIKIVKAELLKGDENGKNKID